MCTVSLDVYINNSCLIDKTDFSDFFLYRKYLVNITIVTCQANLSFRDEWTKLAHSYLDDNFAIVSNLGYAMAHYYGLIIF